METRYQDAKAVQAESRFRRPSTRSRFFKSGILVLGCAGIYAQISTWRGIGRQSVAREALDGKWKDDTWPLRPPTPWDISTDFPYPRKLEYDVTEGTWLRLDVHPQTGEIVFDMLGDLYCLPRSSYTSQNVSATRARPVLLGVPHDSDPHFSPDGTRLIYRSDAELGYENIWMLEWKGCDQMDVRTPQAAEELASALILQEEEGAALARGVKETAERRQRRLVREGRLNARRITNETFRWVSDARFHPSGKKIIATKWLTTSFSIAGGEGWEYPIPAHNEKIEAGSGKQLVARSLPVGWPMENLGEQMVGPEQFIWNGDDSVIYAKNVIDTNGRWTYSKNVHKGIYAIFMTNLTTETTTKVVDETPGGASRPELSRDGRTLAFVRRVRDKEVLILKDLITGTIHHVWDGLTYDLTTVAATMGTYPSFAFTPDDSGIIIWAAGKIWHVPIIQNAQGEREASTKRPTPISFTAHVELRLAETRTGATDIVKMERKEKDRVRAFVDLSVNEDGSRVVFQAAGRTYVHDLQSQSTLVVPTLGESAPYFSPTFVPGLDDLIIQGRWSDTNFTTFELANIVSGRAIEVSGLPMGRYISPILSSSLGWRRTIAFLKSGGTRWTGNVVATANPGLYIGEITLPTSDDWTKPILPPVAITNVRFIAPIDIGYWKPTVLRFLEGSKKLLVQRSTQVTIVDLAAGPNAFGEYTSEVVARGKASLELVAASSSTRPAAVAFVDYFHVYLAPRVTPSEVVWSKPGRAPKGLARLSTDGGHNVAFSGDGTKLFWFLGPTLHSVELTKLDQCKNEIACDTLYFGTSCTRKLLEKHDITVEYDTDYGRLKRETLALQESDESVRGHSDVVVYLNATLLTMENGQETRDVIHNAVLVTRAGLIQDIVSVEDTQLPSGATVIDVQGGYIVPGFIDVHAHWLSYMEFFPVRAWELETFLAYGVTTLHNPSSHTVYGSAERIRVERGMELGPRIYHVGSPIWGVGWVIHQDITSMEEAFEALHRIKAEASDAAISYKNYNLISRAYRQRMLLAARELGMLCVPEGNMNSDWDLTFIADGMTTVEHSFPISVLYDDVLKLWAHSGTGSTPTLLINYGGVAGEQIVWATEDIPNDPKLRRFVPHEILETLAESTTRPKDSYSLFNTSESIAKMVRMGLKAHIGAHGEPPHGLNYHEEMFFMKAGGLTNYEVIRAATSDAARTLGLFGSLGSLSPGKLADFIVYPPGFDILRDDIRRTRDIRFVVRGGRVWDAETLVEVWPVKGRRPAMPPFNAE